MAGKTQNHSQPSRSDKKGHRGEAKSVVVVQKVGSDPSAARHFAEGHDFGIPVQDAGRFKEVAEEAKYQPGGDHLSDPRPAHSGSENRESGVGGMDSGPGSASGGDLDTDFNGSAPSIEDTGDDAAAGEISQGEAAGDDNTEIDNIS
jgi:hypothetical protein